MGRSFESLVLPPRTALFAGIGGVVALFGACMSDPTGISSDDAGGGQHGHTGGTATGGAGQPGSGGSHHDGGTGADAAGNGGENDGTGGNGASSTGGSATGGSATGGTDTGGTNSTGGTAGDDANGGSSGTDDGAGGGDDGTVESCVFHSAPMPNAGGMGGAGGMAGSGGSGGGGGGGGGSGGASGDVTIRTSPFLGTYLADATGRTLYFYGSDLTGDCSNPPVSRCTADCAVTWPPYNAGARTLAPGLDDAAFGTVQRSDGTYQTTYYGWPLYYYKDDVAPASLAGQGKGKTWHVAEVKLPTVVIMREGNTRYLADTAGHTLYVSSADQVGNGSVDPESRCTGSCLSTFKPFSARNLAVVQSLEQDDFWSFVHPNGSLQLGYKGAPLYRSKDDRKAGDMTGTATTGFTAALP
jgi:predicted lipoprotein with Yx(FWY)xxD motif